MEGSVGELELAVRRERVQKERVGVCGGCAEGTWVSTVRLEVLKDAELLKREVFGEKAWGWRFGRQGNASVRECCNSCSA